MDSQTLNAFKKIFDLLQKSELSLSDLYKTCSGVWPEDIDFFSEMANTEIKHSGYIRKISGLINSSPLEFESGRIIKSGEIDIMIEGAKYYASKVKEGKMEKLELLKAALKLEDSIIERKYSEILKSSKQ